MSVRSQLLLPRPRFVMLRWVVVFALLCASCAMLYRNHLETLARSAEILRQGEMRARQAKLLLPPPVKNSPEQVKKWTALQNELDFPWVAVFQAIDEATATDIELVEFSPEKSGRKIKLSGEARNDDALTAYLDALREQKILHTVHLVKRAELTRADRSSIEFIVEGYIR